MIWEQFTRIFDNLASLFWLFLLICQCLYFGQNFVCLIVYIFRISSLVIGYITNCSICSVCLVTAEFVCRYVDHSMLLLLSWRARQALPIWGDKCSEEMRNSTRLWIWMDPSLPRDDWQPFIDWGITQGRLSLPTADVLSTIVKWSMLTDVDKLSSCSRFSDSVVGFTGQKTQPTASQYWRSLLTLASDGEYTDITAVFQHYNKPVGIPRLVTASAFPV